jgi:hypothetical protein
MATEWTDELEAQMKYIGDCCRGYVWMFKRDIQKFAKIAFYLRTTGIGLGVLGGCLGVLAVAIRAESSEILIGITSILSFGGAFCQGFLSQNDYDGKIESLKRQASRYSGIANNIRRQLSLPRHERERGVDYSRWISSNYDEMTQTCIDPTDTTIEEYRKECVLNNLPFPDDTGRESNIGIHRGISTMKITRPEEMKSIVTEPVVRQSVIQESPNASTGQPALSGAFEFTDSHMKYELERLKQHEHEG